jgi:Ca2+-binding RTX toxin-like protein
MNRLYILLTVMVVMVGALFAGHQVLAKVLSGTAGDDTLVGTDTNGRFTGLRGADSLTGHDGEAPNTVRGEGGFDTCYGDKYDRVKCCERKY